MGTNFYFIPKISDEDVQDILTNAKKLAESKNYLDLKELKSKVYKTVTEIHLGKRSGGWQFLWNHNDLKYYNPDLKSIKEFLEENEGIIYDEYGDFYTVEQFFNEEIKNCLYKDSNHVDSKTYRKEHPNEPYHNPTSKELHYKNNIYNSNYGEFLINKLRFADTTEFS